MLNELHVEEEEALLRHMHSLAAHEEEEPQARLRHMRATSAAARTSRSWRVQQATASL